MIQFPVIRRIDVRNYQLFANENSEGILHTFDRGVHAVVGINGLGKTTLLAMIYRVLLGPYDQSKSNDVGLLGSQHELSDWRNKRFFRDRVKDGALHATVEADIAFGEKILTVRRRLNNLQVEYLALDQKPLEATDEVYQKTVIKLSGTATFFDFFAILRYLVFYLEDRVELIWDRRSQFDMLRILLFDTAAAKSAASAYDAAQAADSRFRNRRAILGRDRDRLAELEAAAGHPQASQFQALQTAVAQAEEHDREQAARIEEAQDGVDEARLRRERALLDLQEARTALEYEEQAHYRHLFPDIGDTAAYVFSNLLGGAGCLVCGNTSDDAAKYLRKKLDDHHCPICDSSAEAHEKILAPAEFSRARLRRLKIKVDQLREAAAVATDDIDLLETEYQELTDRREDDRAEWQRLRHELSLLGPIEAPTHADIEGLRTAIDEGQKELDRLLAERSAAEARYGRIVKKQKGTIERTVRSIRKRFREYASMVLAERCELNVDKELRPIGQEGKKFEFIYFQVMMTSGVFDQSLSTRANDEAVSESQREFLDIAFRLALIDSVTGGKWDSMLVLETPEASLDSLFVAKAGEVFRFFGEDKRRRNVLIASTNLNNEEMLSALLGAHRAPARERTSSTQPEFRRREPTKPLTAPIVPVAERKRRIINLLELAAPNAALKEHRAYYTKLLKQALAGRGQRI